MLRTLHGVVSSVSGIVRAAWDLIGLQYDSGSDSGANRDGTAQGLWFKPDGTRYYEYGSSFDDTTQWDLSVPWDLTSRGVSNSGFHTGGLVNANSIFFRSDGLRMYQTKSGSGTAITRQFTLSIAWDVTTAGFGTGDFDLSNEIANNVGSSWFTPDGLVMFVFGNDSPAVVYKYNLGTAWDITTAVYASISKSLGGSAYQATFKTDGSRMYIQDINTIFQWDLGTNWDITTAVNNGVTGDTSSEGLMFSHAIKPDGTLLYSVSFTTDKVFQYSMV